MQTITTDHTAHTLDLAVGVPVFERTAALQTLLESLPASVHRVHVADNGHTDERATLYAREWPFDLEVHDLDYDAGVGACRRAIADAASTEYLFIGDCDMRIVRPSDLDTLIGVLEREPHLGGIAGWLWEGDRVRAGAADFHSHTGPTGTTTLYKDARDAKLQHSAGIPYAVFDNIPQAAVVRTAVFEAHTYDDSLQNTEHAAFFLGQQRAGEWQFASTPAVVIHHRMHTDPEYRAEKRQKDTTDLDMLAREFGIDRLAVGPRPDWVTTRARSAGERAFDLVRQVTPPSVWVPTRRVLRRLGVGQ